MARTYVQRRVAEWHALMNAKPAPEKPTNLSAADREIHAKVCAEEFAETIVALVGVERADELFEQAVGKVLQKRKRWGQGDLVEIVDGCCDSMFVAAGVMWRAGVEDGVYWDAVCDSNDSKAGGSIDANGKYQKGPNYCPPNIRQLLLHYGWEP